MQETSLRVMNMVRRTLLETPEVTDRALYAAAVALEPSIGTLSLKQFQARYPARVRRLEIGPPTRRSRNSGTTQDERPIADRPHLYAPGQDTLVDAPPTDAPYEGGLQRDGAPSTSRPRRVRRDELGGRIAGPGKAADEAAADSDAPGTGAVADTTAAAPAAAPSDSDGEPEPRQPWPLRLNPDAASRLASPHLRLVPPDGPARKPRRQRRSVVAEPRITTAEAPPGSSNQEIAATGDPLPQKRTHIRNVLFAWAREIAGAATRGQLVGVLARADDFADQITRIAGGSDAGTSRATNVTGLAGTAAAPRLQERPALPKRERIEDYAPTELDAMVRWIMQTEPALPPDELVARAARELGFRRRGRQIVAGIQQAAERVRRAGRTPPK